MQSLSEALSGTIERAGDSPRLIVPIAIVAGAVFPLGFAPYHFWPATLVALAVLFGLVLQTPNRRRAFATGWWFGIGQYGVGVSWVYVSIRVYGSASVPLAVSLVALFVAGMALFSGLAMALVGGRFGPFRRAALFVVAWVAVEWLLSWFLTGFPWLLAGYASFDLPIRHYAPLGGVMLVSVVIVASAVLLVICLIDQARARWVSVAIIAGLWLAGWGLGGFAWTESVGEARRAALVQGNIPQELKWTPAFAQENRRRYERLSAPVWDVDLVVWPEAAVTSWWPDAEPYLAQLAARGRATFVTGVPVVEFGDDVVVYNGAVIADGDRQQSYKKRQLVPFGDYVPFEALLRGVIAFFDLPMSNARPGPREQPLLRDTSGLAIAMAVCYEVAYGELVRRDAAEASVLATISNDTWFGASVGPHQHLAIARMRSIETGRYMLRATNNGVTAIIEPSGTVAARLPQFEEGVLVGDFFVTLGMTPYVRFGNLWVFLVLGGLLGGVFFSAGSINVAAFFSKVVVMDRYDAQAVEARWQSEWERRGTNTFSREDLKNARDPYYNLMMFPYPSAEGLHIGNIYAYTGADANGRYWRLQGKDVFEPIGFDAFGIHSENYALKIQRNPNDIIPENIANFTRVLKRFGGMYDWNHTVNTTHPDYYRWTQWVFLKLYDAGLVERREAPVNWCPSCKTVLANEQVIQGECERCESAVEQRELPQWFFRITDYSERLLDNIESIDWSEITKKAQTNWIGRSEGATIDFAVQGHADVVKVFTTRPDTLFGATYMVLAPEHPLVDKLTTPEQADAVAQYRADVAKTDLVERQKTNKDKTGVFTGSFCVNPTNGQEIPIWIADYVLMGYGTGAIMAVPAHDQRDFDFATTFDLPIIRVIAGAGDTADTRLAEAYSGDGVLVNSAEFNGLAVDAAKRAVVDALAARGVAEGQTNYRLHDWCVSRQRYWGPPIPMVHCDACGAVPVPESSLPVELPYLEDFYPDDSGISPLARATDWFHTSCPSCGKAAHRDTDVTDNFLCSGWYFLRYPSTDDDDNALDLEITKKWLPVDCYIGGNEHAVLHLMYSRFITMALADAGLLEFEEPFDRFRAHGLIVREGRKMSKSRGNVIVPDDLIEEFGADTMRLYLLFLGPYEQGGDYQGRGIQGPHGFLNRLWQSVHEAEDGDPDAEVERAMHRTIRQVSAQVPELGYNTAIAAMMEYLNVVRGGGRTPKKAELDPLVIMIAPFTPHIAEELFEVLGHSGGLFDTARWPSFDESKTVASTIEVAVQVNGKVRGRIEVEAGIDEAGALAQARGNDNVARHLADVEVVKVIWVPGKLLNLVVR